MFRVKRIDTGEIQTVLSVEFDSIFHQTHFLVWDNNGWRWRPAHKYVPPNVEVAKGELLNGKGDNNN